MNYVALLPIKPGQKFSEWVEVWCQSNRELIQGTIDPENTMAVRERNEKLSAALPILVISMSCARDYIIRTEREWAHNNPRPLDKGITAWNSAKREYLADFENFLELLNGLHQAVATRLSVSQSSLRSKADEVKHGLN